MQSPTYETAKRFISLFQGRTDVTGTEEGGCAKIPPNFPLHLSGKRPIGIYPLLDDGTCFWGTVDIDKDNRADAEAIRNGLDALGIQSVVFRSRSKGWHVTVFFFRAAPAWAVRALLRSIVEKCGLPPDTEVFPKQDTLAPGMVGNYIRLPYAGPTDEEGHRAAWGPQGPLSLDEFLSVEHRNDPALLAGILDGWGIETPKETKKELPLVDGRFAQYDELLPCAEACLKNGLPAVGRAVSLFTFAKHLRRCGLKKNEAVPKVNDLNEESVSPLSQDEVDHALDGAYNGRAGHGFRSLGCEESIWVSNFCPGKDQCIVHKPQPEPSPDTEQPRFRSFSVAELYTEADNRGPLEWIVPNLIAKGHLTMFSAPPKSGKTWGGLSLALAVSSGSSWANIENVKPGRVLWIDEEMGIQLLARRMRQIGFTNEMPFFTLSLSNFRLDVPSDVEALIVEIAAREADLVIIDSLRRVHQLDENDNSQVKRLFPWSRHISEAGPGVTLIHHDRKRTLNDQDDSERSSGAMDFIAQVDTVLGMTKTKDTYTIKSRASRLTAEDQTPVVAFQLCDNPNGTISVVPIDPKLEALTGMVRLETAILTHLRLHPGDNTRGIRDSVRSQKTEVSASLHRMVEDGRLIVEQGARGAMLYYPKGYEIGTSHWIGDPLADD